MNKKALCILTVLLVLLFALGGCGNQTAPAAPSPAPATPGDTTQQAGDAAINFPTRNISFIVPWAAGGSSDIAVRYKADLLSEQLGVTTSVVNREGAGGTIALTEAVNSDPTGYEITFFASGVFTSQPHVREVHYSLDDFHVINGLTLEPIVMVASAQSGISSLDDLLATDRPVSFGFSGAGSLIEMSQRAMFGMAGMDNVDGVPFDGGAPTITALLGGHIDLGAAHPFEIEQHIQNGDLIPIGLFSPERDDRYPNIPTFLEQGFDIDIGVWKGFVVPIDKPDEIVQFLYEAMREMVASERFVSFAAANHLIIDVIGPQQAKARLQAEFEVNRALFE